MMKTATVSGQTIGSIACSKFKLCSFSAVTSNPCLSNLRITEAQYDSVVNKTIAELIGEKLGGEQVQKKLGSAIGQFFGEHPRSKRTPKPRCENCTEEEYEDVTPLSDQVKMDGREELEESDDRSSGVESDESSGEVIDESYGKIDELDQEMSKRSTDSRKMSHEEITQAKIAKIRESIIDQLLTKTDDPDNSTDFQPTKRSAALEASQDNFKEALDNFRTEHIEDMTEGSGQESDRPTDSTKLYGSTQSPSEIIRPSIRTLNMETESSPVDFIENMSPISDSNDMDSSTVPNVAKKNNNFEKDLDAFRTVNNGSEKLNSSMFQELQTVLNLKLNSTMLEYAASFANISESLPKMSGEFTVSQFLQKMDINDWPTLKHLLNSMQSVFGNLPGFSQISNFIENLSSSGLDLKSVLKMIPAMNSSGTSLHKDAVLDLLNSFKVIYQLKNVKVFDVALCSRCVF